MGGDSSKAQVQHNGDSHIEIINTQVEHSNKLDANTTVLWIVLGLVAAKLVLTLWLEIQRRLRKRIVKKASDLIKLKEVTVQK